MKVRNFNLGSTQDLELPYKCREALNRYEDICKSKLFDDYIQECYELILCNAEECVSKLFFERTSNEVLQRFKIVSHEKGIDKFKEVYLAFGKFGVKTFTNALKNDIKIRN